MSEPRKIAAADVKVGDRIRCTYGDTWSEGVVAEIDHKFGRWLSAQRMNIGGFEREVWLLDRPSRQLPTEPGSVIRASIRGFVGIVCQLTPWGTWEHTPLPDCATTSTASDIGDDWVELAPKEDA